MASPPSFLRRHRRTINLSTFLAFLVTAVVMLFTPPAYEATAMISLPPGVAADQVATHLALDASEVELPASRSIKDFHFSVKPVCNDSPAVAALIVEEYEYPTGIADVANNWASTAVEKLGGQAAILTHAEAPRYAVRPPKARNVLLGTFLGFLIGLGIAGLRESSKQRGAPFPIVESVEPPKAGTN